MRNMTSTEADSLRRYSYVKYDKIAEMNQSYFKDLFVSLSTMVEENLPNGRAKSLVQTKLEEAYMWVGKAIRDDLVARGPAEEQPARNNG